MKRAAATTLLLLLLCISSVHAESHFYAGSRSLAVKGDTINYIYHDRVGTDFSTDTLPFGQTITAGDRFGYTSKEQDGSGLHHYDIRYYDSNLGRFTSIDPIPSEPSYQYVTNNPLNYVDPTGTNKASTLLEWANKLARSIARREAPELIRHEVLPEISEEMIEKALRRADSIGNQLDAPLRHHANAEELLRDTRSIINPSQTRLVKTTDRMQELMNRIDKTIEKANGRPDEFRELASNTFANSAKPERVLEGFESALEYSTTVRGRGQIHLTNADLVEMNSRVNSHIHPIMESYGIRGLHDTAAEQVGTAAGHVYPGNPGRFLDTWREIIDESRKVNPPSVTGVVAQEYFVKIHPFTDGNGRMGRLVREFYSRPIEEAASQARKTVD